MSDVAKDLEIAIKGVSMIRIGIVISIVGGIVVFIVIVSWLSSLYQELLGGGYASISDIVAGITGIGLFIFSIMAISTILEIVGFAKLCSTLDYGCGAWKAMAITFAIGTILFALFMFMLNSTAHSAHGSLESIQRVVNTFRGISVLFGFVSFVTSVIVNVTFYSIGESEGVGALKIGGILGILLAIIHVISSIVPSNVGSALICLVLMIAYIVFVLKGLGEFKGLLELRLLKVSTGG